MVIDADVYQANRIVNLMAGGRHQEIYRALGIEFACPLQVKILEALFEGFLKSRSEMMIQIENDSVVQTYGGRLESVENGDHWLRVKNDEFNLVVNKRRIHSVWLVRIPTEQGWITRLEAFDYQESKIITLSDNRLRCRPESEQWTQTLFEIAADYHFPIDQAV